MNNRQYHFEYNGKTYNIGTVLKIKDWDNKGRCFIKNVTFEYYTPERGYYTYNDNGQRRSVYERLFYNLLVEVTDEVNLNVRTPVKKYRDDLQIPDVIPGWAWYIAIMTMGTLFNERIAIWVISSIVFFNWRKKVKEEKGVYYER